MNRKTFTKEQIKELSKNKNVSHCGLKSVRYTKKFKLTALKQYNEDGRGAVEIFKEAGFDLTVIGKRAPYRLMNQWNTSIRPERKPELPLRNEATAKIAAKRFSGGKELRTLKAKVAYLEAENDFLAQLRARKRK
ncbi:MAG TPA: hypothetical protein ENN28_00170 [Candidatus Uhrbacteria bacterium]|nr:hypothetical protein [Candidatus Uhrbacteria bacterium]